MESNDEPNSDPESDVTVCFAESLFVQVTLSPAFIVKVSGLNANPEISVVYDLGFEGGFLFPVF